MVAEVAVLQHNQAEA